MMELTEILNSQEELIKTMAYKAHRKLKKPTILEIEDLQQEGRIACIKAITTHDPKKEASLDTWIYLLLTRHFYDMVYYSYKKIDQINYEDLSPLELEITPKKSSDFIEFMGKKLSPFESKYIKLCLQEQMKDPKNFRERVRSILDIEEKVEEYLRYSIREIVKNYKQENLK